MDPIIISCKELELHKNKFWHYVFKIYSIYVVCTGQQTHAEQEKKTIHLFCKIKQKSLLNLLTFI